MPAHELAATVIRGAAATAPGSPPDAVDDVVLGHCYPTMDAPAIGRVAALDAGLPVTVPGLQVDRRCGSGLQAVLYAAMQVQTGASEVVLAGGAESMSNASFYSTSMRWGVRGAGPACCCTTRWPAGRVTAGGVNFPVPGGMLETAENLRREYSIPREEQDEFAVRSHQRAAAARDAGRFADEIVPVTVKGRKAPTTVVDTDEHIRPDSTGGEAGRRCARSSAATIPRPPSRPATRRARTTGPRSASSPTRRGRRSWVCARWSGWSRRGVGGVPPATMGIGPVPAVAKALDAAELGLSDIDLIELNEAFAAQVLACTREWKLAADDLERINVNGSGISLGHPVGATGGRILATLTREMARRDARYGLETMCIGGGQGLAAVFERVR